jgi:Microbial-type PARG, catalytic domain
MTPRQRDPEQASLGGTEREGDVNQKAGGPANISAAACWAVPSATRSAHNGINPGSGFLSGARAQEEVICRSRALHQTLVDDPMYAKHRKRQQPDSADWAIYSQTFPSFGWMTGWSCHTPGS